MKQSWLKPLLVPALATSMLVGCTGTPTVPNPASSDTQQEQTITSSAVKDFLAEIKQALVSVRSVNGATEETASAASGYRLSGYSVASSSHPWDWETTHHEDGSLTMTRHVIEKNASGEVVTDIRSTRNEAYTDGVRTYSQEDVVTQSTSMAPGTYAIAGKTTTTGDYGDDTLNSVTEQTTTYTAAGISPRKVTLKSTYTPGSSVLTLSGVLPDGATIAYKSTQTGALSDKATKTTLDLSITSPSGKTIVVENALDSHFSNQDDSSSSESKGYYQVALDKRMQVRFEIDIHSLGTYVPDDSGGGSYTYTYPRNQITAELRDGAGKRVAEIGLEQTTDHSKPPAKGTLTLEGEAPTELDMDFMMEIMRVQMSLPYTAF